MDEKQKARNDKKTPGQQPNKIEELKKRIERMSKQAKMSVTTKNQANQEALALNRSTSEDRATQTISGSNQYKRGNRGTSKEMNTIVQPCN